MQVRIFIDDQQLRYSHCDTPELRDPGEVGSDSIPDWNSLSVAAGDIRSQTMIIHVLQLTL